MMRVLHPRFLVVAVFLLAVAAIAGGIWRYAYVQALNQLEK